MNAVFRENISIAIRSIRSNLLRTMLTIFIIAFGIMALVGILTAIDAIKGSINSNFTNMGANTFTVRNREMSVRIGRKGKRPKRYRPISYDEGMTFVREFSLGQSASLSTFASGNATIKFGEVKSNPNTQVIGGDENYLATAGYELESGRNFSTQDILNNTHVVIVGQDVIKSLFKKKEKPLEQVIHVGAGKYRVIGILKEKGNASGFGGDRICIIPLGNAKQYFSRPNMSYTISVIARDAMQLDYAVGEATGLMRKVRKVPVGEEDNFEITKSDSLSQLLIEQLTYFNWGAIIIGIITLAGAAIGLMNIMLVSVTERTREIGTRKAIGATRNTIKNQFLMEAIVICQLGGIAGIVLGIILGNSVALMVGGNFLVPWNWMIGGALLCLVVGVISGYYPAVKASKLDPIEALRYE
ncbi:MAG: ABC transporter permease [Bacteroidia bacterium]|nr:ABC transporter permease [Bacteroidia bacterium]